MGGGAQKAQTTYEVKDPWSGQQPYLKDAMSQAQALYNQTKATNSPGYQGDFKAQATPQQISTFQNALGWNNTTGQGAVNNTIGAGNQQLQQGQAGLGEAQQGLTNFNNKDWTQQHIQDAGQYANNPFMQSMIDAASSDAKRTFSEQTMRGIDQNAAATGNMNSTRAGVSAGIAQRGLADEVGNLSANMRGNAWNTGLQMSQADQGSLLQGLLGKANVSQGQVSTGLGALSQGTDMQKGLLDQDTLATSMLQGFDQSKIDNNMEKYDYANNKAWNNLGNYWSIVGDKSWGGTTSGVSKTKDDPSTMSTIGSGMAILGSLFRCDARVKNIIQRVGETPEGIPLYLIQYKDAPFLGLHVTPLAQDVALQFPNAVSEVNGVLCIDTRLYDWR
jgi:hypothetical protein